MSEFLTFAQLGVRHIIDAGAMDHILFLFALAAIYRFSDWREIVRVVTAFTIGHSITLAAAVLGFLPLSPKLVEFLIPLTIIATCIENIVVRDRVGGTGWHRYRPIFAIVFGMVHGAGFGSYLKSLFVDSVAVPLLGFNIGIELGQMAVLSTIFIAIWVIDLLLSAAVRPSFRLTPVRLRIVGISSIVLMFASRWAVERAPW